jgi:hypothetical protein
VSGAASTPALRRGVAALAMLVALAAPASAAAEVIATTPTELLDRLDAAWKARDAEAYLALWRFETPEVREEETDFARHRVGAGASEIRIHRPDVFPDGVKLNVSVQAFSVQEPRASLEQWLFRLAQGPEGWALVGREAQSRLDGLVHLSLDSVGYKAAGLTVSLEDFTLTLHRGTLFMPPESLGPTVLVFVGEATVRFKPANTTEQDQLRQFCGAPELVDRVGAAFIRLHPADLHRVLSPVRLEPDPEAARRLREAQKVFREQSTRSFVLDAVLPGAPWSLLPSLGDALATFETDRNGTLTLTVNAGDFEGISLFDRSRRRQICLYPAGGRGIRYSEDDARESDLLRHDLQIRFDPARNGIIGQDTLSLQLQVHASTLRLKLDDSLNVHSVRSKEGGNHLFFRVRHQNSLMVSLGPLAGRIGPITLTVHYSGILVPGPIDREVLETLQAPARPAGIVRDDIPLETVLAYTNRIAWYPQTSIDDHAVAHLRFDVPEGYLAIAGGTRSGPRTVGDRTIIDYDQDRPGKYMSVVVGRLFEAGSGTEGPVALQAFGTVRTRSDASATLARAAAILRFFAGEFGPCPYRTLNIVLAEAEAPGGHSPPGMIFLTKRPFFLRGSLREDPGSANDSPDFFLAHELAHQWWGHGVAGQNYHERWLSEGMAQYAAAQWIRRSQGENAFRQTLQRMARWAFDRTSEGPISLGHRLGHIKGDSQTFRAVVYDKGAYVLHMLRAVVGDDSFRTALTALQAEHPYGKIGTDDLREALERASGRPLEPYFREWVLGTALPRLRVSQKVEREGSRYRSVVDVTAEALPGPVPLEIAVVHEGGREARRVVLPPEGGTWTIETSGRPRKVEANAGATLLARIERK